MKPVRRSCWPWIGWVLDRSMHGMDGQLTGKTVNECDRCGSNRSVRLPVNPVWEDAAPHDLIIAD
jgi:hypothetical protein